MPELSLFRGAKLLHGGGDSYLSSGHQLFCNECTGFVGLRQYPPAQRLRSLYLNSVLHDVVDHRVLRLRLYSWCWVGHMRNEGSRIIHCHLGDLGACLFLKCPLPAEGWPINLHCGRTLASVRVRIHLLGGGRPGFRLGLG